MSRVVKSRFEILILQQAQKDKDQFMFDFKGEKGNSLTDKLRSSLKVNQLKNQQSVKSGKHITQ